MFADDRNPTEELDNAVLKLISERVGKHRSIEKVVLVDQVNHLLDRAEFDPLKSRAIRESVERLRSKAGTPPIMSSAGWSGYWIATTYEEAMTHVVEEGHRASQITKRCQQEERNAAVWFDHQAQPELFG